MWIIRELRSCTQTSVSLTPAYSGSPPPHVCSRYHAAVRADAADIIVPDKSDAGHDCHLTTGPLELWRVCCDLAAAACLQQSALTDRTGAAVVPGWTLAISCPTCWRSVDEQMSPISEYSHWVLNIH
ncbi:hypothetical protein PBY51_016841 [Eleginops maclovinus]|uniref:Uncharacterized protein n=1 Tax=Eleginops maclovinus TaxID=56733 RepID=A0AAN7WV22_ELEMC|nr:hypothetical protein PBY51_016841 [Eleginops maclovinus]